MKHTYKRLAALIAFCFIVVAGCSNERIPNALNWDVKDFQYTNQEGKAFSLQDLEGKVWVTDFIFTNCETVCPPMTANLARLQEMAKDEGLPVEFVSFSVDPENDTPEVLQTFISKFTEDTSNWTLLTGYSQEEIEAFAKESFHTLVDKPEGNSQVLHGTSFYLVDQNGKVMKSYKGVSNTPYEDIIRDIKRLTR